MSEEENQAYSEEDKEGQLVSKKEREELYNKLNEESEDYEGETDEYGWPLIDNFVQKQINFNRWSFQRGSHAKGQIMVGLPKDEVLDVALDDTFLAMGVWKEISSESKRKKEELEERYETKFKYSAMLEIGMNRDRVVETMVDDHLRDRGYIEVDGLEQEIEDLKEEYEKIREDVRQKSKWRLEPDEELYMELGLKGGVLPGKIAKDRAQENNDIYTTNSLLKP